MYGIRHISQLDRGLIQLLVECGRHQNRVYSRAFLGLVL